MCESWGVITSVPGSLWINSEIWFPIRPEETNNPFSKPKRLAHSSSKLFTVGSSIYSSSPSSAFKALSKTFFEGLVTVSDLKSYIRELP